PAGDAGRLELAREARGAQGDVLVPQRHREGVGEREHHLPARLGAARLEEGEVPRGDVGGEREVELAHAAGVPPVAEERGEEAWGFSRHARKRTRRGGRLSPTSGGH